MQLLFPQNDLYHWRQVFIIASLAQYASTFAYVAFGSAELQVWNTPGYELQSDEPPTNSRGMINHYRI